MIADFYKPARLAIIFGAILLPCAEAQLDLAKPERAFDPTNPTDPYGLLDQDDIPVDPTYIYAYTRWGVIMSQPPANGSATTFEFTKLTKSKGISDVRCVPGTELFFNPTTVGLHSTFPLDPGTRLGLDQLGNPAIIFPSPYDLVLFRKLHFENSNLLDSTLPGREVKGMEAPLSADTKKLIVLIHGWNSSGQDNSYTNEFANLVSAIQGRIQNTDWRLVVYHWEADADTGFVDFSGNNGNPIQSAVKNGTEAAESAHQHGKHLGELLHALAPGIEKIHFISHSAGSWAARSAARYMLQNTGATVQVTLLDPFIPGACTGYAEGTNSNLTVERMGEIPQFATEGKIYVLENYFSVDLTLGTNVSDFGWTTNNVHQRVDWSSGDQGAVLPGATSFYGDQSFNLSTTAYRFGPTLGHFGPIQFYADTVNATAPSAIPAAGLANPAFNLAEIGWRHSMFYREPYFTLQPQSPLVDVGATANFPVTVGVRGLPNQTPLGLSLQWQIKTPSGTWTNTGTGSTSLEVSNVTADMSGSLYRVLATYDGQTETSSEAMLTVNGTPPAGVPAAPSNLAATAVSSSEIDLSWADNSVNETGFEIERKQGAADSWTSISTMPANSTAFADTGLSANTAYSYRIKATNSAGDSDYSNSAIAATQLPATSDDYGDSSAQAYELTLGTPVTGLISSPTDVDWFKVEVTTPGTINFALTVPADKDYDLELFGPDGAYIKGSYNGTGAAESITYTATTIGTYYVRVYGYPVGNGSFSTTESYNLSVTHVADNIDLDHWTWRYPLPEGNLGRSALWSGSQFVAVGDAGTILTSASGSTWTQQKTPASNNLRGIAWNGSQFVAVGDAGTILTSPDGVTWTSQNSGTLKLLNAVTWGGNQFVAVGSAGTILTSPDGINWISQSSGNWHDLYAVTCGGGKFVAVGGQDPTNQFFVSGNSTILTSVDGAAWTDCSPTGILGPLFSVTWIGNQFVAFADYTGTITIFTSADGVNWTFRASNAVPAFDCVAWNGTRFVALSWGGAIETSLDGITWTLLNQSESDYPNLNSVAWSGNQCVAVGLSGAILTSPDGGIWTSQNSGTTRFVSLTGVTWGGGKFVAVGGDGSVELPDFGPGGIILTSPDGVTWTRQNGGTGLHALNAVTWNGSQFVAVGEGSTILTSPDGINWTKQIPAIAMSLLGVTWGGGQFVAVGWLSTIQTSPDGINWTGHNLGTTDSAQLFSVTWNGSLYVAVGDAGVPTGNTQIWASPDGTNWTRQNSGLTWHALNSVVWSGSQFVAVGNYDGGAIVPSPDGINWIVTSPDGINWTIRNPGLPWLQAVTWTGNKFVAVGYGGILTDGADTISDVGITVPPVSQTVAVGQSGTFTVLASGLPTLTYQWQKNGANIDGATSATLTLNNVQASDAGAYTVIVANVAGSATSDPATLTVNKATPVITWAAPSAITYGTALSGTQLNATARVPGTFVYSPASGAILGIGSQTLNVTFTPTHRF